MTDDDVPYTPPVDRMAAIQLAVKHHRHAICGTLSGFLGVLSIAEPLAIHLSLHDAWIHAAILLAAACFVNAALTLSRNAQLATHLLVAMVAGFVTLQIDMRTGLAWAFVVPPLILFLHPPLRGMVYVFLVTIVLVGASVGLHNTSDLNQADTLDFASSFIVVSALSTLFSRDLRFIAEAIASIALSDPLTGLIQRDIFVSRVNAELARSDKHRNLLSLAIIDIDNMKHINDTWGHAAGDFAIQEVSRCLMANLRREDFCARIGGDEFMVLVVGEGEQQALRTLQRVFAAVGNKSSNGMWPSTYSLTLSAGIAERNIHRNTFNTLYAAADTALLLAKQSGRHRINVATRGMRDSSIRQQGG